MTGWGNAAIWPIAAVFIGLGGGFALGRSIHRPANDKGPFVAAYEEPRGVDAFRRNERPEPDEAERSAAPPRQPPPVEPALPSRVKVRVLSTPPGAQVARADDGEPLGTTPVELDLPASRESVRLLVWKKGFAPAEVEVVPRAASTASAREVSLDVELHPAAAHKKRHAGGKGPGGKATPGNKTIDPFN
jgi:hypothetical protein